MCHFCPPWSGSRDPIVAGSNRDPQHCFYQSKHQNGKIKRGFMRGLIWCTCTDASISRTSVQILLDENATGYPKIIVIFWGPSRHSFCLFCKFLSTVLIPIHPWIRYGLIRLPMPWEKSATLFPAPGFSWAEPREGCLPGFEPGAAVRQLGAPTT